MKPHLDPVVLFTCLVFACGGRSSLRDSDATNALGGTFQGTTNGGTLAATGGRESFSTGGFVGADGGFIAHTGGARATGGSSARLSATTLSGTTLIHTGGKAGTGGVNHATGGASASGGTYSSGGASMTGGPHATGGTFTGMGGASGTGGDSLAQGGASASSQGGVGASGGTAGSSSATDVCGVDQVLCGTGAAAQCVDTLADPKNCGRCGHICAKGAACSYGACDLPRCQPTFKMGGMPTVETDRTAVDLEVGDFNGDGNLDFATSNSDASTVSILLGNGKGAWSEHIDFATGDTPVALAIGDLNGDHNQDIVTANLNANSVSVLLGLGNGALAKSVVFAVGNGPRAVAIDDFNGDGRADIATASRDGDSVSILLGSGDGTFAIKADYPAGTFPDEIVTGDFNADGKKDLITNGGPTTASVLLNAGNGTFMAPSSVPSDGDDYSSFLSLGDLNSDGNQDLMVGRPAGRWRSGSFGVLFGVGDGSFLPMADFAAGPARAATSADLDGDGKLELVASAWRQSLNVLSLNGDGTLARLVGYPTPAPAQRLAVGDFNGDHWLDIATLDRWGIYVLLASGNGKFDAPTPQPVGASLQNVLLYDLDGDKDLDLAGIARDVDTATATVEVQLGLGDGTFVGGSAQPISYNDGLIEAGDLDGDGQPDLVTARLYEPGVSVLWNSGHASYPYRTDYATATATGTNFLALGDLDNNGKADILVASDDSSLQVSTVTVLLNAGSGSFAASVYNDSGPWATLALADFNHDGKLDLVQSNGNANGVTTRLGLGDGSFGTGLQSVTNDLSISAEGAVVGDLNGDGHLDLVSLDTRASYIDVLLGVGDGTFAPLAPQSISGNYGAGPLALGDLNGDGILDLLSNGLVSWVGYEIVVMLGSGDGTFTCMTASLPAGAQGDRSALGDLNGDHRLDLVIPNPDAKSITVLLNQSL